MSMNIDRIEDELGGLGFLQFICIISATVFLYPVATISQTGLLYNAVPRHRCSLPATFNNWTISGNITYDDIANLTIPTGDSCHRYAFNLTECIATGDLSCLTNASEKEIIECDEGYYFDKTYYDETVISEWELVCSKDIWIAILNSLYFMGVLIGSPPVGYMVDWYGRKFSMIVLAFGVVISGIGCAFAPNLPVYCVFRFLEGVTTVPACGAVFAYANELSSKKLRTTVGTYLGFTTGISHTVLPLLAYFLRDWRDLNLCLALMPIAFLITSPLIPETPRWLLVKGRTTQAKAVLDRIAKSKGKTLNDDDWALMLENETSKKVGNSRSHLSDLFRRPFIRIVTIIVMFNWAAINCVFYGLVLNVGTLTGDPYMNAVMNGFTEIIASVVYIIILALSGPKAALIVGTALSGAFCLIAMVAGEFSNGALEVVRWTSITGKLFASVSFYATYQYTNDVYPTITRGKAMAVASTSARIGSVIIPFILHAQSEAGWVVSAIFGILGLSSALCTVLLPNASSKELTSTLEEAEDYYCANMKLVARCLGKTPDIDESNGNTNHTKISEMKNSAETKML